MNSKNGTTHHLQKDDGPSSIASDDRRSGCIVRARASRPAARTSLIRLREHEHRSTPCKRHGIALSRAQVLYQCGEYRAWKGERCNVHRESHTHPQPKTNESGESSHRAQIRRYSDGTRAGWMHARTRVRRSRRKRREGKGQRSRGLVSGAAMFQQQQIISQESFRGEPYYSSTKD